MMKVKISMQDEIGLEYWEDGAIDIDEAIAFVAIDDPKGTVVFFKSGKELVVKKKLKDLVRERIYGSCM